MKYASLDKSNPDSLYLAYLHPDDGRALRYHFDEFMVEWIPQLAKSIVKDSDLSEWDEYCGNDLLQLLLEQSLYVELIDSARAIFRRNFALKMGWCWDKPVYINPLLANLVRNNVNESIAKTIKSKATFRGINSLVRLCRYLRRKIQYIGNHEVGVKTFDKPMIGVELVEGVDPSKKNDTFWMSEQGVNPAQVILIIERKNLSLFDVEETIQYARKTGASIVTTDDKLACQLLIPHWRPSSGFYKIALPKLPNIKMLGNKNSRSWGWLSTTLEEAYYQIEFWAQLFEMHNIVIYQHLTEGTTDSAIKRIAASRIKALQIGKMRSQFFEWNAAAFHFQHQVAMVWNKDIREVLTKARTRTSYVIETGYTNDYKIDENSKSKNMATSKFSKNVTTVCVVYDNHPHINNHFTLNDLENFYDALILVAKKNPTLGLLIKSKKSMIISEVKKNRVAFDILEKHGRCITVSGKSESASTVAKYAHIAVGIPCSTATCEAALMGCVAFIYDPSGARRFNEKNSRGVVFRDINQFKLHLDEAVNGSINKNNQEAFRNLLINSSNENARIKASRFINTYLKEREHEKSNSESLVEAINKCNEYVYSVES